MKELNPGTIESSKLVEQTFDFWFNGKDHIRSPFPKYIQPKLKQKSVDRFFKWTAGINDVASKEINDTIIGEKFEEIIFETALDLVLTEDEKLTIHYPFMPRIGDEISNQEDGAKEVSQIISRTLIKEKDHVFLSVKLEKQSSKQKWETRFELPA